MHPMYSNRPDVVYRLGVPAPISMPTYNDNGVIMEMQQAFSPTGFAGAGFGSPFGLALSTPAVVGIGAGALVLGAIVGYMAGKKGRRR